MHCTRRVRDYPNTHPQRLSLLSCPVFLCQRESSLQDLCAYDLESCVPTSMDPQTCYPPQKLNRRGDVPFFRVGTLDGKVHVIFPRRKHVRYCQTPPTPRLLTHTVQTDTVFQMFEVVRSMEETPVVIQSDAKPEWFRPYRVRSASRCGSRKLTTTSRNSSYLRIARTWSSCALASLFSIAMVFVHSTCRGAPA